MNDFDRFLLEHDRLARRHFLRLGVAGAAAAGVLPHIGRAALRDPALDEALALLESFFTPQEQFRDVSRGKPLPHSLPDEKKHEVGLTRETWRLEVVADEENPARIGKSFTKADGTALDFAALLKLGE